jgi:hypothetical protein
MNVLLSCDDVLEALTGIGDAAREDEALREHWNAARTAGSCEAPSRRSFADACQPVGWRDADSSPAFGPLGSGKVVLVEATGASLPQRSCLVAA